MINIEDDIVIPEPAQDYIAEDYSAQNDTAHNYTIETYPGQYDVIEPEHGVEPELGTDRREAPLSLQPQAEMSLESRSPATNSDMLNSRGRYVPKPKYRNIFSTLRRRIRPAERRAVIY